MIDKFLYLNIHALHTLPPSNANRDESGMPKMFTYGGKPRAFLSSQACKKAMKESMERESARNTNIKAAIEKEIKKRHSNESSKLVNRAIKALPFPKKAGKKNNLIFSIGKEQAKQMADLALKKCNDENEYRKAYISEPEGELLIFGRMFPGSSDLTYDASCQISHAFSTHKVIPEEDFFTVYDDLEKTSSKASLLSNTEYLSATFYRYASLNVTELFNKLSELTSLKSSIEIENEIIRLVNDFTEAFVLSLPTGKISSFSHHTFPYAVYVTLSYNSLPFSRAFEEAVYKTKNIGYEEASAKRLVEEVKNTYKTDERLLPVYEGILGKGLELLKPSISLSALKREVENMIREKVFY